jgi:hypothetical protein
MYLTPIAAPTQVLGLHPAHAVSPVATVPAPAVVPSAATPKNLSEAAHPVYQALQSAGAIPPSSDPTFVPPASGSALRLFAAVQAVAAERIYPAPVFSFSA